MLGFACFCPYLGHQVSADDVLFPTELANMSFSSSDIR